MTSSDLSYPHQKRICVDFDGTLVEWGELNGPFTPNPGAIDAVRNLYAAGYEIVIFTSRMSPTWWEESGVDPAQQLEMLEDWLDLNSVPFEYITSEKVPAKWYIDDRAIGFRGDWSKVMDEVYGQKEESLETWKVLRLGVRSAIVMAPSELDGSQYQNAMNTLQDFAKGEDPELNIILIPGAVPADEEQAVDMVITAGEEAGLAS